MRRALPVAATLLALTLVPAVTGVSAEIQPSATCQARRVADRVVVAIELRDLLDDETRRLLRLGMKGRLHVEATVFRKRLGLFEHIVDSATVESELSSPRAAPSLLLNGRDLGESPTSIRLERIALRLADKDARAAPLTLRAAVSLRVVTVSSLSKVAAWATRPSEEQSSSSIIARGVLSAVVADLTRSAECTCAAEPAP